MVEFFYIFSFDSSNLSNMIYAEQFLQLSSRLPSKYIYGIGEHRSSLQLSTEWQRFTLFNHDTPPRYNVHDKIMCVMCFVNAPSVCRQTYTVVSHFTFQLNHLEAPMVFSYLTATQWVFFTILFILVVSSCVLSTRTLQY